VAAARPCAGHLKSPPHPIDREAPVNPADLKYTAEHEWVRVVGDALRIGITAYAQEALGDIVFVTLPAEGTEVTAGQTFGEVESTKSVSDVYAPLAGTVSARNEALDANPELVNSDPYGEGWMVEIIPAGGIEAALGDSALLDAAAYESLTGA
jgi:glycine cleavage system H protein